MKNALKKKGSCRRNARETQEGSGQGGTWEGYPPAVWIPQPGGRRQRQGETKAREVQMPKPAQGGRTRGSEEKRKRKRGENGGRENRLLL